MISTRTITRSDAYACAMSHWQCIREAMKFYWNWISTYYITWKLNIICEWLLTNTIPIPSEDWQIHPKITLIASFCSKTFPRIITGPTIHKGSNIWEVMDNIVRFVIGLVSGGILTLQLNWSKVECHNRPRV